MDQINNQWLKAYTFIEIRIVNNLLFLDYETNSFESYEEILSFATCVETGHNWLTYCAEQFCRKFFDLMFVIYYLLLNAHHCVRET